MIVCFVLDLNTSLLGRGWDLNHFQFTEDSVISFRHDKEIQSKTCSILFNCFRLL